MEEDFIKAASRGDIDTVNACIKAGVDVNAQNSKALSQAAGYHRAEVVRVLLDAGARLSDNSTMGWVAGNGNLEVLNLLLDFGTDPSVDDNGAVKRAREHGHCHIIQALVDHMRYDNTHRYYYDEPTLYILYHTPLPSSYVLPGTNIWCSNPNAADWDYITDTILAAHTRKKSARS